MNPNYLTVVSIGKPARDLLACDQTALVIGVTSRGVFLRLASDHVVFITDEQYRGPLTLNLKKDSGSPSVCRAGDTVLAQAGRLTIELEDFTLDYRSADVWAASPNSAALLPVEKRIAYIETVADRVLSGSAANGWSGLLVGLLGIPAEGQTETDLEIPSKGLPRLKRTLEAGDLEAALAAAETFLGLGRGLTPSGDDLLLGLLLALNRWGERLEIHFDIQRLNQGVLEMARRRTMTLSSDLLSCAASGQADERLVAALDGLLTGQLSPDICAAHLITWGSTSGCDAFVGMALAILVLSSFPLRSPYAH